MLTIKRPNSLLPKASLSIGAFILALVGTVGVLSIIDPKESRVVSNSEARLPEQEEKENAKAPDEAKEEKKEDSDSSKSTEQSAATPAGSRPVESYTAPQQGSASTSQAPTQPGQQPAPSLVAPALSPTPVPIPTPTTTTTPTPAPTPSQPEQPEEEPKDGIQLPSLPLVNGLIP